jgi:hypothetical protein
MLFDVSREKSVRALSGEQRFAVLMIVVSVIIFLALWRSERH